MTSIQVEAAQPVKVSKMPSFSSPRKFIKDTSDDETEMELPLPDVVLCSALSANILHGQRQRQRRRHKASIQTKGREHLEETPLEEMMEPLVQSLSELLGSTTISMNPDPEKEKEDEMDGGCVYHTKRRRTISNTSTASKERANNSTASKLSTLSSVVLTSTKLKKDPALTVTIEDTPEGVFNAIRGVFKNVFSN